MTSLFSVLPGARLDYNDDYGYELIRRGQFRLYMGGGGAASLWPTQYALTTFAGAMRPIRTFYQANRPHAGDILYMRTRDGRVWKGHVTADPTEQVVPWSRTPDSWEWSFRRPRHQEGSLANWSRVDSKGAEPTEDYVLDMSVAWEHVPTPSAHERTLVRTRAAIQRRRACAA